jgi:MFS family permease
MSKFNQLRSLKNKFPRQFWLMCGGMLFNATGVSMIWPFITIYLRNQLDLPLTAVASLLTISSVVTLVASFVVGPRTDSLGRKPVMVAGLMLGSLTYFLFTLAETLPFFIILMVLRGTFRPMYRVGVDAMVADLIPVDDRAEAYSLLRMANNAGISIGPMVGGFLAIISYSIIFYIGAFTLGGFALLVAFFMKETLPVHVKVHKEDTGLMQFGGYRHVFQDHKFIALNLFFLFATMSASLMFILLPVYAKENFSVLESQYGFIMAVNAGMVVSLQYLITRFTKRSKPLPILAAGAFLYALGVGSVAIGDGFWDFFISMAVMTLGELMLVPTANTLVSEMAPIDSRGRYMSIFSLSWGLSSGFGPIVGGLLNDNLGPVFIWYGGLIMGLVSMLGFLMLRWRGIRSAKVPDKIMPA